jgi:hypothetical protein
MLYLAWLFIAAAFFYLAFANWRNSMTSLRPFAFRRQSSPADASRRAEADPEVQDFIADFERYLDSVNAANRSRFRSASIGFIVAGVISLLSMVLVLR